ncbi:MAG TPA: transglutaminase domain-containing protein [Chitinophagaceae bacterium]|nr:transglutaminase domain-containing protein [Chitinophagaceae bacterium]
MSRADTTNACHRFFIYATLLCCVAIAFSANSFAQPDITHTSFAAIDDKVKFIEPAPPAHLALTLTRDCTNDQEKVRAIFSWIAEHITYRVRKPGVKTNAANPSLFEDTAQWTSANDRMAEMVLQSRSAVCDGYARLFKSLCDYAGLRAAVITGYAKGDLTRQPSFRCNHTWNAVYVDSSWKLIDVTWASGYTSYSGDQFFKRYDEKYYLASPEEFLKDHFPDDLRWTLTDRPATPRELSNAPYKIRSFSKYRITAFSPASGVIEAGIGDTLQIVLQTADALADSKMASDTIAVFDTSLDKINPLIAVLQPMQHSNSQQQLTYQFVVADPATEWLHIAYNNDIILRYRLKIIPAAQLQAGLLPIDSMVAGW